MSLTFLVAVPTLLTVFSISRQSGDRRAAARRPRAVRLDRRAAVGRADGAGRGLSLVMLWLGGFGGLINMSYAMNAMIHNTSWVTAHFHLIFGGAVVIMYFAIAYEMWPHITGKPLRSKRAGALAALAVVLGHADHHHTLAYRRADGTAAAGRDIRLQHPAGRPHWRRWSSFR